MDSFSISAIPIDPARVAEAMASPEAGAFASFEGWVRNHNEGRVVATLDYEVFESLAVIEGKTIIAEATKRFGLIGARAIHRSGALHIGDCAVWVGVTARHRGEAFDACRYIIDQIKLRLPIWKKEGYIDGRSEWVNCAQHHEPNGINAKAKPAPPFEASSFYDRQARVPEIGSMGQEKLNRAKVLIVGVGGLGCAAALALVGAGVGTIGLVEDDTVDVSNLHRQILYDFSDIGAHKVDRAARRLSNLNPSITLNAHKAKLTATNAEDLCRHYDVILDCTDNFRAKYLLNDVAILFDKLVIQASVYRFEGQVLSLGRHSQGCLRCLWPEPPTLGMVGDCGDVGTIGTVPMILGTLQANEAIKYIVGLSLPTLNRLVAFDLQTLHSQSIKRQRNSLCRVCGDHPDIMDLAEEVNMAFEYALQGSDSLINLGLRFRLVDVREESEFLARPIVSDYRIPFSRFDASKLDIPRATALLVLCEKGHRSYITAGLLREKGWLNAFSLTGGLEGLQGWQEHHADVRAA